MTDLTFFNNSFANKNKRETNMKNKQTRNFASRFLMLALVLCTVLSSLGGCAFIIGKDLDNGELLDSVNLDLNIKLEDTEKEDTSVTAIDTYNPTDSYTDTSREETTESDSSDTAPNNDILSTPSDNSGFFVTEEESVSSNETEFTKIVAKTEKSVVEINTETAMYSQWSGQYIVEGAGSGVIISKDSKIQNKYYIVTNNHVIDSAETITVRLYNGIEFDANLIATDVLTDVALLSIVVPIETPALEVAVMAHPDSKLYNGQDIYVIGNPLGELGGSVSKGIISKTARKIKIDGIKMELMQIDAAVNPGNSGGALFNMDGVLIGVVNAKYSEEGIEGLGFAIPINTVKSVVLQLADNGYVKGRAGIGVSVVEEAYLSGNTTVKYPTVLNGNSVAGTYTDENGIEQSFGFTEGDVIIAVGGETVNSVAAMQSALNEYKVGENAVVSVNRKKINGRYYTWEKYEVTVVLTEYVPGGN